jgi:hypothetical protein
MARPAHARRLTTATERTRIAFEIADRSQADEIARLIGDSPVEGRFSIAFRRDPDPFASEVGAVRPGAFVIARDGASGQPIGLCERVTRRAFVDGEPVALAYLGALRVVPAHRHRIAILRGGFAALRALEHSDEAPFALTSIADDNASARRLLTAGIEGLPTYRPYAGYSTFALRPRRARVAPQIETATERDIPALAAFLDAHNAAHQFAPAWSVATLRGLDGLGLTTDSIRLWKDDGRIRGSIALWDQRALRQTVVLRYPAPLGALRPLVNFVAPLTGAPRLPPPGAPLTQATIALVAAEDKAVFEALLAAALDLAHRRRFDAAALGMPTASAWRAAVPRRGAIEYRTTLYCVSWPGGASAAPREPRPPHPELGFL